VCLVLCLVGPVALSAGRVGGALAKLNGGSGYSGTLSSNAGIRQQQLICDPPDPTGGSTSTLYDPTVVKLTGFRYGPGYQTSASGGDGVVEVKGTSNATSLMPISMFLVDHTGFTETGYVQIRYQQAGGTNMKGQIDPTQNPSHPGLSYGVVADNPGVTGGNAVDTHALVFDQLNAGASPTQVAAYTFFADNGADTRNGGPRAGLASFQADFMAGFDDTTNQSFTLTPAQISPVSVSGNFIPEPAAAGALAAAAGVMLLRRGRLR
jgi:hypothetical protein